MMRLELDCSSSATVSSRPLWMATHSQPATSDGMSSGRMMRRNVLNHAAPLIAPASSNSRCIWNIAPFVVRVP